MNRVGSSLASGGCSGVCAGGSSAGGNASEGALDASDTIAHISHRPMAITRLSNASMNHANQIISCCPPPSSIVCLAYSTPPSDSISSPRCRGEKYNTVGVLREGISRAIPDPVAWRAEGPILPQSLSDIPEISFFREGCPDREPGDLVAGLFDGALDLLLLSIPSFE